MDGVQEPARAVHRRRHRGGVGVGRATDAQREHTSFQARPLDRLQRTGFAAMMTVYGPRSGAESMIAGITRMHARVRGVTPDGRAYCATDPELLDWVHSTASFGFLEAYHAYIRPLSTLQRDRFYQRACWPRSSTAPCRRQARKPRPSHCSTECA